MISLKKFLTYLAAPALSLLALSIVFKLWSLDFNKPFFGYFGDELFYLFVIKNIVDTGWIFENPFVGMSDKPIIFSLNDFPIHGEFINLSLIKFINIFTDNVFLISNCFFIITFALVSLSAFIVLRIFKISTFTATLISIIYSFLPYHFFRNSWHLFLSNYLIIPISTLLAIWMIDGKIKLFIYKNNKISFNCDKDFFITLLLILLIAINGLYYAFFTCWVLLFAYLLFSIKEGKFFNRNLGNVIFINILLIFSILLIHLPTFINWAKFGMSDKLLGRDLLQSDIYALKIINLFLPTQNHLINYLAEIRKTFESYFLNSETYGESLGIIGLSGFVFSLLWIISKNYNEKNSLFNKTVNRFSLDQKDINFISNFANLNLISVFVFGSGALILLFCAFFPSFRSHARFVVFISFFSLSIIALILDKILEKSDRKNLLKTVFVICFALAILDQTGNPNLNPMQNQKTINRFENDKNFINQIENILPKQAKVFVLPTFGFPEQYKDSYESLICYIHSKELHWSYPAMAGRYAAKWQEKTANLNNQDFIKEIENANFSAVYIDRKKYGEVFSYKKLRQLEKDLKLSGYKNISSQNLGLTLYSKSKK